MENGRGCTADKVGEAGGRVGEGRGQRGREQLRRELIGPASHTRAHAAAYLAERHALASPGRRQHVSSTRSRRLRDSSAPSSRLQALVASPCLARLAICNGTVNPPRNRGPVLFVPAEGSMPNSSGAISQVCLRGVQYKGQ